MAKTEITIRVNKKQLDTLSPKLKKLGVDFDKLGKEGKQAGNKMAAGFNKASSGARKLERETTRLRQSSTGLIGKLGAIRNQLLVFSFATTGAVLGLKKVISEASNLEESINAVNVVFKDGNDIILKFGETAAKSVGLANSEFNQLATQLGALLIDTGKPLGEVADLTIELTKRASDLASVFNTDVKDALSAINQAIRGETEAIRRYAADVTDATLQTFLLSQGINKQVTAMTQAEKKLLRIKVLLSQTKDVQGDFRKTSDSLANATRILGSRMKNLAADIGDSLVPAASNAVAILGNLLTVAEKIRKFGAEQSFVISQEQIDRFKLAQEGFKGISEATKEFLALIREVDAAQDRASQKAIKDREAVLEQLRQEGFLIRRNIFLTEQQVEMLEARKTEFQKLSKLQLTLALQALGITRQEFDLSMDLLALQGDKNLLEAASNALITTKLKKVKEVTEAEIALHVATLDTNDAQIDTNDALIDAKGAAAQFTNSLAQAAFFGRDLKSSLLSVASSLLSALIFKAINPTPGISLFGQHGLDFMVPSGFPNDSFRVPLNVSSGERVQVTPANQVTNNSTNSTNTFNIVINNTGGELDAEDVSRAFNEAVDLGLPIRGR